MVIESDFYIAITKSLNENKHNDVEIIALIIITKSLGSQRIGQNLEGKIIPFHKTRYSILILFIRTVMLYYCLQKM